MGEVPEKFTTLECLLNDVIDKQTLPAWKIFIDELKYSRAVHDNEELRHLYNDGHVYCRCIDVYGMTQSHAISFCKAYNQMTRGILYESRIQDSCKQK